MRTLMAIVFVTAFVSCKKHSDESLLPTAIKYPNLSCSKTTDQIDTVRQMIVGTYDWAWTLYRQWRQPSEIWTPQNKGMTYRYVFKPDAQVDYYENKKLQWTNKYVVDYELKVSTFYLDSATIVIIYDKETGQRTNFFRAYLCNDSAIFYCPYPYGEREYVDHFERK